MSAIIYNGVHYGLDQKNLAYVHAVTHNLLAADESFSLGIMASTDGGALVRHFLWISPSIPVEFLYDGDETVQLDESILDGMLDGVDESGMVIVGDGPMPFSIRESAK
ncbi:DUF7882 family protein [Tomitella biformata]|uniref:DUF7882 family protein n=1 Tax=Tomitella biformata TaxID=630403 RepID=UPI000463CA83|nr:hypothetical protein [Tomitella biformata]